MILMTILQLYDTFRLITSMSSF